MELKPDDWQARVMPRQFFKCVPVFDRFACGLFADEAIAMYEGRKPLEPIVGRGDQETRDRLDEAGVPYGEIRFIDDTPDPTEVN